MKNKSEKKLLSESQLIEKWKDVIDPPGNHSYPEIKSHTRRVQLAKMFENLMVERSETGDIDKYDPILIPMIRRGFPSLIALDIFGTQPMSAPTGLIFAMRSGYQNSTDYPIKHGDDTQSIVLVLADATNFTVNGDITSSGTGAGNGVVRYKEDNTVLVEVQSGSFAVSDNVDNADPYADAETTVSAVYTNEKQFQFLFYNYAAYASTALAESASTNMKEMGIKIDKTTVTANTYKLKAKYTDELEQDLKAVHNLDAETELTKVLGEEMAAELNKKFIRELQTKAQAGGTFAWNYTSSGTPGRWEKERTFEMYSYINTIANQIAKTTLRGRGNFLVVSLDICSKLETLSQWKDSPIAGNLPDVNLGSSAFMGTLANKFKVFVDQYAESDYCVVGYKGNSEWDAGIFYCPYVPVNAKKGMGEEDGQPRLFFQTRYGLGYNPFNAELYYRQINITL